MEIFLVRTCSSAKNLTSRRFKKTIRTLLDLPHQTDQTRFESHLKSVNDWRMFTQVHHPGGASWSKSVGRKNRKFSRCVTLCQLLLRAIFCLCICDWQMLCSWKPFFIKYENVKKTLILLQQRWLENTRADCCKFGKYHKAIGKSVTFPRELQNRIRHLRV